MYYSIPIITTFAANMIDKMPVERRKQEATQISKNIGKLPFLASTHSKSNL